MGEWPEVYELVLEGGVNAGVPVGGELEETAAIIDPFSGAAETLGPIDPT
jgi:hypothetical protein